MATESNAGPASMGAEDQTCLQKEAVESLPPALEAMLRSTSDCPRMKKPPVPCLYARAIQIPNWILGRPLYRHCLVRKLGQVLVLWTAPGHLVFQLHPFHPRLSPRLKMNQKRTKIQTTLQLQLLRQGWHLMSWPSRMKWNFCGNGSQKKSSCACSSIRYLASQVAPPQWYKLRLSRPNLDAVSFFDSLCI